MPQVHQHIRNASLLLLAFFLPLSRSAVSISIGILFVNWLIEGQFSSKWHRLREHPLSLAFIGLFGLYTLGLTHSDSLSVGLQEVWGKSPLLILPLVIGSGQRIGKNKLSQLLLVFVVGTFLACLLGLGIGLYNGFAAGEAFNSKYLTYSFLADAADLHPAYFTLFLGLSSFALFRFYHLEKKKWPLVLLVFNLSYMILLSSRAQLLAFMLLAFCGGIVWAKQMGKIPQAIIACLIFALISLGAVSQSPALQKRFQSILDASTYSAQPENIVSSFSIRRVVWNSSWQMIKENPWLGVGTGEVRSALVSQYKRDGYHYAAEKRLDSHNQYIGTILALGVFGGIYLIVTFLMGFHIAWKQKNWLYLFFLLFFTMACLTENMLDRQWGITFFALFNTVFAFQEIDPVGETESTP
ncbi:MAG: O-antigen ligase family protein [Bacteroidota bacterium]